MIRLALALLLVFAAPALAQEQEEPDQAARTEARRFFREGQAHDDAGRPALAARAYLSMYEVMRQAGLPRAPLALYSAGRSLAQVSGRETEARDTLQRFLTESTPLTEDAEVRDMRSAALEQITELEARAGTTSPPPQAAAAAGGGISPVGPILLGVGSAAVLAGIITGAVALVEGDGLRATCGGSTCPETQRERVSSVRTLSNVTDGLLIGGGLAALTGLVLTLVLREPAREASAAVACDASGCLAVLRGSF